MSDALDEGELLAAYLAAETDEVTTARVTRRLQTDPQFAARLDALARARARLQRLDEVAPPAGFAERLTARLAAERAQGQPARAPATAAAPAAARRSRSTRFAMAAAIALVAVLGTATLGMLLFVQAASLDESATSGGAESAADSQEAGPAAAPQADSAQERAEEGAAGGAAAATEPLVAASVPEMATDAEIATRIREALRDPVADPPRRERELRQAAGLPTAQLCAAGVDATAIDVVRQEGDVVITALATDRQPPQIVVLDPATCTQIRALDAAP